MQRQNKNNQNPNQNQNQNPLQNMSPQISELMNMAKQMTKGAKKSDMEKIDIDGMHNMIDQFSGMFGAKLDQGTQNQIKDLTKNMLNSLVNDIPDDNHANKNKNKKSMIELPKEPKEQKEPKEPEEPEQEHEEPKHKHREAIEPSEDPRVEHASRSRRRRRPFRVPENKDNYEVLDPKDIVDLLQPRTEDLVISLNVSLEELYNGAEKKIAIKRERIRDDELVKERKKLVVGIEPGMRDEQIIRYNKQASEKFSYETGDIVILLKQNGHSIYERDGDNLFVCKNISLYESYALAIGQIKLYIVGLDGRVLNLKTNKPLHENNGHRKIVGFGMPVNAINKKLDSEDSESESESEESEESEEESEEGTEESEMETVKSEEKTHGDLFVRFNLILPKELDHRVITGLKSYFPPINTESSDDLIAENIVDVTLQDLTEEDIRHFNGSDSDSEEYSDEDSDEYSD